MADVQFEFEWIDPLAARGPELRATWSRLKLLVDDEVVTKVYDAQVKSVRDSIYLPLYPLAEWIARNWWFIHSEIETPGKQSAEEYRSRHSIRFGQEGYALPDLTFQPVGEQVLVTWAPVAPVWAHIEFLSGGGRYVDKSSLAVSLGAFIEGVLHRLEDEGVSRTPLTEEWQSIRAADEDETAFCFAAAKLGEDPYAMEEEDAARLIAVARSLPRSALFDFLATTTLATLETRASAVLRSIEAAASHKGELRSLAVVRHELPRIDVIAGPPWERGYALARAARSVLGLNGQPLTSNAELATVLQADLAEIPTLDQASSELAGIDAVMAGSGTEGPGILVSGRSSDATRFSFARALGEYFADVSDDARLVTRAYSTQQKLNRAFAAEFLVPATILRDRVSTDVVGIEEVDELGRQFGVSPLVIQHQLENHQIARVQLG
jgi:hypothetical protein